MITSEKIKRLYHLPDDHFGFTATAISNLEKRIHITLPLELKHYYLTLGTNENINYSHNRLLTPEKEIDFSQDRYLMIYEENQEVILWGIKEEDLSRNNPPVWGNYGTNENPDWYLETNSTDHFFLLMAVHNGTLGGLTYNANYFGQLPPNVMHFIQQTWSFVPEISNDKQKVYTDNYLIS